MNKKKFTTIIHGTTDVFVNLGILTHAVEALIHEVPKSHWGVGRGTHLRKIQRRIRRYKSIWIQRITSPPLYSGRLDKI